MTLIGFTGRDAKTAATQTGKRSNSLLFSHHETVSTRLEWKEKTYWHDCVVYGGYAPFAAKLNKGAHIVIEGELTCREYNPTIETVTGAVNVSWPVTAGVQKRAFLPYP
jgi:single-strand DNA-binding protein